MKKLISVILCFAVLVGVLAFAGCKKNNDGQDMTADGSTAAPAVSTEPETSTAESTTTKPAAKPTQAQVSPAPTTGSHIVTLPAASATEKPNVASSTGWNGTGIYKVGSGSGQLKPGEYYIVKNSSKSSVYVWNGKMKDDSGEPLACEITLGGKTHTLVTVESGYVLYVNGCKFISASVEHPKAVNGKYAPGTYKIGRDIPKDEYIVKKTSGVYGGLGFKNSIDPYVQNVASDFEMFDTSTYYVLSKDGYVEITGCEFYDADSCNMASIGCDGTTPAMYKVGKDIKAGTYTITPDGSGKSYYSVSSSPETVDLKPLKEVTNVKVSDGEYVYFFRAAMKYCENPNSGLDPDATLPQE